MFFLFLFVSYQDFRQLSSSASSSFVIAVVIMLRCTSSPLDGAGIRADLADAGFYFVCDMRNDLNGFAEVIATAFLAEDGFIDLAACEVVCPCENAICEPLVVTEIQVGFSSVSQNIDLTVLKRIHRAGVYIQIRVEFLKDDFEAPEFQQRAERCSRQSFSQ